MSGEELFLTGKTVKVWLRNGFHYEGEVLHESAQFITIQETRNATILNKNEIRNIELREGEGV